MRTLFAILIGAMLAPMALGARLTPVTRDEAAAVFAKAEKVMTSVLQLRQAPAKFTGGAGVATREQILAHFADLYAAVQPKFKYTAPKLKAAPTVISFKDARYKQLAQRLEVLGLVDRYGPLVTSKSAGLEPAEFGDALGYFMARVAELTHTPSSKFSPYLSG